jgi:hypothetical protein
MQQPPYYPPPQARPAPKKSGNGCLIALAVVGGLVLLVVGALGFGAYRLANTKEGKAIFGMIGDMTKVMAEAANAPGAAEVRKLGCDQGMVIDMKKMNKLFEYLDASAPSGEFSLMVVCQVGVLGTPPKCDDVAHTYAGAVTPPPHGFAVSVTHSGSPSSSGACQALYDSRGVKVRDLAPGSTPRLPGSK